ncbi:FadR/GntR family transcriptional regulator [Gelidibacter salicanalis]|uniref:FadR family transcriptional regulator n=1 Tax=Gelidibacter salicanalis TaxID=291193 RepID=A0A934KUS5_9FLAO|nr:FCD domain-containing protein [Gelidibacter salicanalis]MBJ7879790.1 FadR family transcriptional regulator [Gelidibacter salicanalis]
MKDRIALKPLTNLTLVDKVEISITEYIKNNNLKVGDAIPKEMEFAETLGVSRTVIREALTRLRTIGIIDSKKHKGMVLSQPDIIKNFEKVIETNLLGDRALKDIFELRLILEMGMVDLVFARKTDADLVELTEIVERMEKNQPEAHVFSLQNEVAFHGKLYEMSGNRTLKRVQHILLPVFKYVHDYKLLDAKTYKYSKKFVTHRDLLNYLQANDIKKFRKGLALHLEPHFERVLKNSEF